MSTPSFTLHDRLAADTRHVMALPLCNVLMANDKRFPWLILVPRRPDVRELFALDASDRFQAMEEICGVAAALEEATGAIKMNIGALGNMVPQLHIHIIARFEQDEAWPGAIWGVGTPIPFSAEEAETAIANHQTAINRVRNSGAGS